MAVEITLTKRPRGRPRAATPKASMSWAERLQRRDEKVSGEFGAAVNEAAESLDAALRLVSNVGAVIKSCVAATQSAHKAAEKAGDVGTAATTAMLLSLVQEAHSAAVQGEAAVSRAGDASSAAFLMAGDFLRSKRGNAGAEAGKKPCIVDGVRYDSLSAVARAFSLKLATARQRMLSPHKPTWHYEGEEKAAPVASDDKRKRPVVVDGTYYESVSKAAEALSIPFPTVHARVKSKQPAWADWREATPRETADH